jgi:hypothetical protein
MEQCQVHYINALASTSKKLISQYKRRTHADPEAARSEAAVYCMFEKLCRSVQINENSKTGGSDFICSSDSGTFLLEATCLKVQAVEAESGIKNGFLGTSSYRPISAKLYQKTVAKAHQLGEGDIPHLLAITTEHSLGTMLMNIAAAKSLLVGNSLLTFTINDPNSLIAHATELRDSVFYSSPDQQNLDHVLRTISAVLLMPLHGGSCHMICILNPSPIATLEAADALPFCKVEIEREPLPGASVFSVTVKNQGFWTTTSFLP